jgi:PPP family 3-phenylpropionic acid transporter
MSSRHSLLTIRLQYFLYFAVLGIFLPYFNLYCYHLGFSGAQIGVLSAVRSLVMVVSSTIWGLLADRFHLRRRIYIICSAAGALTWLFFLTTTDFWLMLLFTVIYVCFYAPIIAFLEAFTMDQLAFRKESYGRVRAWGSVSFILVVILLGWAIDQFPIRLILVLIFAGSLLQALGAFRMPRFDSVGRPLTPQSGERLLIGNLLNRHVGIFLLCGFLMLVSQGTYYGFFSIHLENLGYTGTFIGMAWAAASIAEILVMIKSEAIFKRFTLENVLLFSFAVAVVRWLMLCIVHSPVLLLLTQILHAVTYGTFHMASILYIDRLTSVETKTIGQVANNAVQYGMGLMTGFFLNGFLYERTGSAALFLMSAGIAAIGGVIFWGYTRIDRIR